MQQPFGIASRVILFRIAQASAASVFCDGIVRLRIEPPVIAFDPDQARSSALLAVQLVALLLPQVNVLEPPRAIAETLATRDEAGADPTVTMTSTEDEAPPRPSQTAAGCDSKHGRGGELRIF